MTLKHVDVLGNLGTARGDAHQESGAPEDREGCGACQLCPLPGLVPEASPGEEDMEDMECSPEASKEPSKTCRWQGQ